MVMIAVAQARTKVRLRKRGQKIYSSNISNIIITLQKGEPEPKIKISLPYGGFYWVRDFQTVNTESIQKGFIYPKIYYFCVFYFSLIQRLVLVLIFFIQIKIGIKATEAKDLFKSNDRGD
jgi:hypothetical protein